MSFVKNKEDLLARVKELELLLSKQTEIEIIAIRALKKQIRACNKDIKRLEAGLALNRKTLELMAAEYCQLKSCFLCPVDSLCYTNTLAYDALIKHFHAQAKKELEDAHR